MSVNIFLAFIAGIVSFLSPCIFPIIPSYIGYIGAATYSDGYKKNSGALKLILFFVLGFTIVFTAMGVAFSSLGLAFNNYANIITKVSGLLVILLGLNMIFNFISLLDYEKRIKYSSRKKGLFSSLLLGMAFGAGWSPCIGPILASILFLAGNSDTVLSGLILLLSFSIGLGLPFIVSGLSIAKFREKTQGVKRHLGKIRVLSGLFIISIGIFITLNRLSNINIALYNLSLSFTKVYLDNKSIFNTIFSILFMIPSILTFIKFIKKIKSNKRFIPTLLIPISFGIVSILSIIGKIRWDVIIGKYLTFQGI